MLPVYSLEGKVAVVIDIFRASSAICAALHHGVKSIIPVKTIEEATSYKKKGFIAAAERKGAVVDGFDFGNSPYSFMEPNLKGETVVLTTSNGTHALKLAEEYHAGEIIIGSFLNISAICQYLEKSDKDVVLICAGWKNKFNLEDSIFAGEVVSRLKDSFHLGCDAAIAAMHMFENAGDDMEKYLRVSSHARRLRHLNIEKDLKYCLLYDEAPTIPLYGDGELRPVKTDVFSV